MKRIVLMLATLGFASTSMASPNLFHQSIRMECLPQNEMIQIISGGYKERFVFESPSRDGFVYVLTSNRETETWTLMRDNGNGSACIVAEGKGFVKR